MTIDHLDIVETDVEAVTRKVSDLRTTQGSGEALYYMSALANQNPDLALDFVSHISHSPAQHNISRTQDTDYMMEALVRNWAGERNIGIDEAIIGNKIDSANYGSFVKTFADAVVGLGQAYESGHESNSLLAQTLNRIAATPHKTKDDFMRCSAAMVFTQDVVNSMIEQHGVDHPSVKSVLKNVRESLDQGRNASQHDVQSPVINLIDNIVRPSASAKTPTNLTTQQLTALKGRAGNG